MGKKIFGVLQRIGKALMLPVALLPAAGILLGVSNAFQNKELLNKLPALNAEWFQLVAKVMERSGGIVFDNLPLIFAVGVAIGLSEGEGVAGLAAIVGFLVMNVTMGIVADVPKVTDGLLQNFDKLKDVVGNNGSMADVSSIVNNMQTFKDASINPMYTISLGISTLQTGVFGGIIIGIIAAYLYERFYKIELPTYLGFFAGKRFVPIVTAVTAIFVGIVMTWVWPPIQNGLMKFSESMIDSNPTSAAFIFGVIERALIPFGLHHIWYNPFWYQFGEYYNSAGQLIMGDQKIFMEQLKDGVSFTAGTFMTGKFPFMMFGLPASALAMVHEAKPEKRKIVAGIMASAALTSFLTGITEPIEFAFLFVAPALFGIHCIFAGFSFMTMQILNVKVGLTFSGGLIDFILFGVFPNRTRWWLIIVVGLILAVIYYFGFRFMIKKFNLKTPGRENDEENIDINLESGELAESVLKALGGSENIENLDACITRLRVTVYNIRDVDKEKLRHLGAAGVMQVGENIQAIFGPESDTLKTQIKEVMMGKALKTKLKQKRKKIDKGIKKEDTIVSPLKGTIVELNNVPDDIFSSKLMGDGFAINPNEGIVISPVEGYIDTILPTRHAIFIKSFDGRQVFIHVGIDTVALKGEGFKCFVKESDKVNTGDKLLEFDLELVKQNAKSPLVPVIFKNLKQDEYIFFKPDTKVKIAQSKVIEIHKKKL